MRLKYVLFVLAAMMAWGCREETTSATVSKRDVTGYAVLSGELVTPPTDYADVLPPYQAPVEKVMVSEGAWVNEGDVLMTLSFPNLAAAAEQARTNLKNAQANYDRARASLDDEVKRLDAEIAALRSLAAQGEDVAIRLEIAKQQAADARGMLQANMAPYQADVDTAKYNLEQAQAGAKQASVRAPISGTVLKLYVQAGQVVGDDRTKPVATICDLGALVVHARVMPEQLEYVKRHTPVSLTFEGMAEALEGRVERIVTRTNGDAVEYVAIVSFENKQGAIKPGTAVRGVAIKTGEAQDVLAVPTEAVDRDSSGKPVVKVLQGSDWMPTVVEVGLSGEGYTEIKSGLKEGQTVQVKG